MWITKVEYKYAPVVEVGVARSTVHRVQTPTTLQGYPVVNFSSIMFYTSVLQSGKSGELYIGYTKDLKRRLVEHNQGLNLSTKSDRPWKIIYYEACLSKSDAKKREQYLKMTQGHRMLKIRLYDYLNKGRKI